MERLHDLSEHLEHGDLQAVEDAWMEQLDTDPSDLDFFASAAQLLVRGDEPELAAMLLELLSDQVVHDDEDRLRLLRACGSVLYPEPTALHAEMLRLVLALHHGQPGLEEMIDKVGLHRAIEDSAKNWTKIDRLRGLMQFSPDLVVNLDGKGPGRIAEINTKLDVLKVAVQGLGTISVGFAAAPKVLHPLPPEHVLYRRLVEPESLQAMAKNDPEELVHLVFESLGEKILTSKEIKATLDGVVSSRGWTSFWTKVRKSPRLLALPGGGQKYRWADSAGDALVELVDRFEAAPVDEQLELFRKHAARDVKVRNRMEAALLQSATSLATSDPSRAFVVLATLEREGADLTDAPLDPARLAETVDPTRLGSEIKDAKARETLYGLLPELGTRGRAAAAKALLTETEARLLDRLADFLADSPDQLSTSLGDLLNNPRKSPAGFTWLAERAAGDEELAARSPLRLFQQIVAATGDSIFGPYKKRLLTLVESGSTLPRLLPHFQPEQAAKAEDSLQRAAGLDTYQKDLLVNALHLRFPEMRDTAVEAPLYTTTASLEAKRAELKRLLEEEIPTNRRAIESARELGDLRENFEYKSARQRHEYLASISARLAQDLERAREISLDDVDPTTIRVGTTATFDDGTGTTRRLTILGPWESDPERGVLSNESEMAQSVLGLAVGDETELEETSFTVVEIVPYSV